MKTTKRSWRKKSAMMIRRVDELQMTRRARQIRWKTMRKDQTSTSHHQTAVKAHQAHHWDTKTGVEKRCGWQ